MTNNMIDQAPEHEHTNTNTNHVRLTAAEIEQRRNQLENIVIAPFDASKAKGVGYNFSLSEMIYSITRNKLVPICREERETYFYLQPLETVALSYEYLKTDEYVPVIYRRFSREFRSKRPKALDSEPQDLLSQFHICKNCQMASQLRLHFLPLVPPHVYIFAEIVNFRLTLLKQISQEDQ